MTEENSDPNQAHQAKHLWYLRIAQFLCVITITVWFLDMTGMMIVDLVTGFSIINWETAVYLILLTTSIACIILAWRKHLSGGLAMVLWGITMILVTYLPHDFQKFIPELVSGFPFILAGLLVLRFDFLSDHKQ